MLILILQCGGDNKERGDGVKIEKIRNEIVWETKKNTYMSNSVTADKMQQ